MSLPSDMRIREISNLEDVDIKNIVNHYGQYSDLIEKLDIIFEKYQRALKEAEMLDSKIASLTYSNYETFMNTHINAIMLSALRAKANLMGVKLNSSLLTRIERILDSYLLITH
jgi:hypothetical protein